MDIHTVAELLEGKDEMYADLTLASTFDEPLPHDLHLRGSFFATKVPGLRELPKGFHVEDEISITGCPNLTFVDPSVQTWRLQLCDVPLQYVSCDNVSGITLMECPDLENIFDDLTVQNKEDLEISYVPRLKALPRELYIQENLRLRGDFPALHMPVILMVRGSLTITRCHQLDTSPLKKLYLGNNLLLEEDILFTPPEDTTVLGNVYCDPSIPSETIKAFERLKAKGMIGGRIVIEKQP